MPTKLILKVLLLIAAFAGVIYLMNHLRSSDINDSGVVATLLGSGNSKPYNWCGGFEDFVSVFSTNEAISATKKLSKVDASRVCEVLMEPVSAEEAHGDFKPVAQAVPPNQEARILEQNSQGVFRVGGLPFRSASLTKVLSELR